MGAVISRDRFRNQMAHHLSGAPDGNYEIITFQTSFQNKKKAYEAVTLIETNSGRWQVVGYRWY